MSRRKQILSSVKDLSPLPDLIHQAAKRVRRSAADRSREKVRSYVRLLQRDGVERQTDVAVKSAHNEVGLKRQTNEMKRFQKHPPKRARSSSPNQLVTITIREDHSVAISNLVSQQETTGRRSGRQYAVVDYSRLHFGGSSEPEEEEEEEDSEETKNWQNNSTQSQGHGVRRGRPPKLATVETQLFKSSPKKNQQNKEGNGVFVCRRCEVGHDTVEDFLKHFESAHCPELADEEFRQRLYHNSYLCKRCEFYTADKDELERHEGQHSQQPNPLITKWRGRYHCDRCSFSATNSVTLSHHQKTHQKPASSGDRTARMGESIAFACAECMARFADRQDVLRHQEQAHGRLTAR